MEIALRQPVLPASEAIHAWTLPNLSGRLVEISAGAEAAQLTAAFGLVLEAQIAGDRAAWVTLEDSSFFPPDVIEGGIDLDALPVVRVRDVRLAGRAADHLARSGGFGLIVIDLSGPALAGPHVRTARANSAPLLARLFGLARQHDIVVLLLTRKSQDTPSMHPLISLRIDARWRLHEGRHELCLRALKDKRRGPGWTHVEVCRGPAGLR